jgi:phage gpG-like protein
MLTVNLFGDKELIAQLGEMPTKMRQALVKKMTALSLKLESKIKADKLSGQVLKVRSGDLRASIHALPVVATDSSVTGGAAQSGDVKYGRIHEYGGKTAAHEIVATKAKALAFMMGGKQVFAKSVQHPGSVIPERSFMRSGLADMKEEIVSGIKEAVREGLIRK